jgi:hypothetical protein
VFNLPDNKDEFLSASKLKGIFNRPEDQGNFVFDLESAREERAANIVNKKTISD